MVPVVADREIQHQPVRLARHRGRVRGFANGCNRAVEERAAIEIVRRDEH
jgi:hypothetical protein